MAKEKIEEGIASGAKFLAESVINGGYCIGCGACAVVPGSRFQIRMNKLGMYRAEFSENAGNIESDRIDYQAICPFSSTSAVEDEIGEVLFSGHCDYHRKIGYHCETFAGHVSEEKFRDKGSSGGMGTWILVELHRRGLIDSVIHVGTCSPEENDGTLFKMKISTTEKEIRERAKSRYYPVEMSSVLQDVIAKPGKYALVGLPCFIKAFHRLASFTPVLKERVKFTVGIVCGHLKSKHFADMFAWQVGISPGKLKKIDFRKKILDQEASAYGIEVRGDHGTQQIEEIRTNRDFFGSNWGYGFLKYEACDYCDDVVGETADISVGDAWLSGFVEDPGGSNVVVIRNAELQHLVNEGREDGRLNLTEISPDEVAFSQAGGLRHRREGLAYRLYLKDKEQHFRPQKRVHSEHRHMSTRQKKIMALRMTLSQMSHEAFATAVDSGNFSVFEKLLSPWVKKYDLLYRPSWPKRVLIELKRNIANWTRPLRLRFRR